MKVRTAIALGLCGLLALALFGCGESGSSGPTAGESKSGAPLVGAASCTLVVRYQGSLYEGWTVRVAPVEGGSVGTGVLPGCDDGGGPEPDEEIELAEIAGVSPEVALVWAGQTDTVLLREGIEQPPPEVAELLRAPTCDPRDEPIELSGPWLGMLGADGNTELDLAPPYDLDLFVEASSVPRYERAFLTVRVPASLGRPLTRADIESSLWEGGTISVRVGCGDQGTYLVEHVTADPPR